MPVRVFVGDRPVESLTAEERGRIADRIAKATAELALQYALREIQQEQPKVAAGQQ